MAGDFPAGLDALEFAEAIDPRAAAEHRAFLLLLPFRDSESKELAAARDQLARTETIVHNATIATAW